MLAAELHVTKRTLVSWETGARLPPVGMVLSLSRRLLGDGSVDNRLMRAYLLDDLAWQLSLQQDEDVLGDLRAAFDDLEQVYKAEIEQQESSQERPMILFEQGTFVAGDGTSDKKRREGSGGMLPRGAGKSGGDQAAIGVFAVLDILRREPSLVPVVLDFLREMGYGVE